MGHSSAISEKSKVEVISRMVKAIQYSIFIGQILNARRTTGVGAIVYSWKNVIKWTNNESLFFYVKSMDLLTVDCI